MAEKETVQEHTEKTTNTIFKPTLSIVSGAILILMIAAGGYFIYTQIPSFPDGLGGGSDTSMKTDSPTPIGEMYTLRPFVVNLADPQGDRYLKIKISMEVQEPGAVERAKKLSPKLRDIVIMMTSSLAFEEVMTPEGKLRIREELRTRFSRVLEPYKVDNIYFSEFVVQ